MEEERARKKGNNFNKQLDGNYLQQLRGPSLGAFYFDYDFHFDVDLAEQLLEMYM